MIFFSRGTSERLAKLGCKSETETYYLYGLQDWGESSEHALVKLKQPMRHDLPAFYQNDFTGCHEQARENARLVWPEKVCWRCYSEFDSEKLCSGSGFSLLCAPKTARHHRIAMIDAPDAEKYLLETLSGATN